MLKSWSHTKEIATIAAIVLLIAGTVLFPRLRSGLKNTAGKGGVVEIALVKTGHVERHNFTLCCRWFGRAESKRAAKIIASRGRGIVSLEAQDGTITERADLRIVASLFPPPDFPLQGKPAIITSVTGKTITGTVVKVLPQPTISGVKFIRIVWIEGDAINQQMKPGEPAYGEIPLRVRRNVLALPAEAVVRDKQERSFVFLPVPGGYRLEPVKTGLTSQGWVEIVSGISEGTEIVVQGAYELFHRDFTKVYKVAD